MKTTIDGKTYRVSDMKPCCAYEKCMRVARTTHFCSKCGPIQRKKCEHENCLVKVTKGKLCSKHIVLNKNNDETVPNEGETRGRIISKKGVEKCSKKSGCLHPEGCNKPQSSVLYNYEGESKAVRCGEHKIKGMINIKAKRCEYPDCPKLACWGMANEKGCTHCTLHAPKDTMIYKSGAKCSKCENKGAVYGYRNIPTKSQQLVCIECISEGMINVRASRCEMCDVMYPMYGYPGTKKGLRCAEHAVGTDMIIVAAPQKFCHKGCGKLSSFGFLGKGDISCASHKELGMVYLSTKRCTHRGCGEYATHGISIRNRKKCFDHAESGDINVLERKCTKCGLMDVLDKDSMCISCGTFNVHQRVKQKLVADFLTDNEYEYHYDKVVDTTERVKVIPDFRIDTETHVVVIEVDEFQHFSRDCTCEQIRMMRMWQELRKPLFLIRYNPDMYQKPGHNCRKENEPRSKRLSILKRWIDYALSHNPIDKGSCFTCIYLFFDGYTSRGKPIIIQSVQE